MAKIDYQQREECIATLGKLLKPGDSVFVIQRHVSQSGMTRRLSLYALDPTNGLPRNITWQAAKAFGFSLADFHGQWTLTVTGAGMDMHFATVYDLSRMLFGDGYALNAVTL